MPVAPDLRPNAEGIGLAVIKTAAAILGIAPDVLSQRVAEQERREKKIQRRIATAMSTITVIAVFSLFFAFERLYEAELKRSAALAGRAQQAFSAQQYDQAMLISLAALPAHAILIKSPTTPTAEYSFRRAAFFNRLLASQESHDVHIDAVALSPDGRVAVSGDHDGKVHAWNLDDLSDVKRLEGHVCGENPDRNQMDQCQVREIAFSADGKFFATGSNDDTARIWRTKDFELLHIVDGHEVQRTFYRDSGGPVRMVDATITGVEFSPDNNFLATSSFDGTARIWDVQTGSQIALLDNDGDIVVDVKFSPDGKFIATAGMEFVYVWDLARAEKVASFSFPENADATMIQFSPQGDQLAVSFTTGDVLIFDSTTSELKSRGRVNGEALLLKYSDDGEKLFLGGIASEVVVIDSKSGNELWQAPSSNIQIVDATFSRDSSVLTVVERSGRITQRDVETGVEIFSWQASDGQIGKAAISASHDKIITSNIDGGLALWRGGVARGAAPLENLPCVDSFSPGFCPVRQVDYSYDGKEIYLVASDL